MHDFPFKWASSQDLRYTPAQRDQIYHDGWTRNICCKDPTSDRKVPLVYGSLSELKACVCFKSAVSHLGVHAKACNMNLERLLALVKKSTLGRLPYAERVCAAGLATQWLRPHLREGGSDPRTTTRTQLIDLGVPLACSKAKTSAHKGFLCASIRFANAELTKVRLQRASANQPKLTRPEVHALTRQFNDSFKHQTDDARKHFEDLAESKHAMSLDTGVEESKTYNASRRWDLCSDAEAILEERLLEVYTANAGSENLGGFSRTAERLRQQFVENIVIHDQGDIPSSAKVTYFSCCGTAHRGLCRIADAINFRLAFEIGERLSKFLLESDTAVVDEADWISVSVTDGDVEQHFYAYVAHLRYRDPKLCLLTQAATHDPDIPHGSYNLEFRMGAKLDHLTTHGLSKQMLNGRRGGLTSGFRFTTHKTC